MIEFTFSKLLLKEKCPNLYELLINPFKERFPENLIEEQIVLFTTDNYPNGFPNPNDVEAVCYSFIASYRDLEFEVIVTREDKIALLAMYHELIASAPVYTAQEIQELVRTGRRPARHVLQRYPRNNEIVSPKEPKVEEPNHKVDKPNKKFWE